MMAAPSLESVLAWTGGIGATAAAVIKFGTWVSKNAAERQAARKADLQDIINRQAAEIEQLKKDLTDTRAFYDDRLTNAEQRAHDAERAQAVAEGILYRMGWRKPNSSNGWERHEEGGGGKR